MRLGFVNLGILDLVAFGWVCGFGQVGFMRVIFGCEFPIYDFGFLGGLCLSVGLRVLGCG